MPQRSPAELDARGGTFSLRHQFAEDGDCDSQVVVAELLLRQETNTSAERFENANRAVHWLLRAAEGGHEEALKLLKKCYHSGVGLTPIIRPSVEACLSLTEGDIIASKVGYQIFGCLTMSDNEDSISEETFAERVEVLLNDNQKNYDPNAAAEGDGDLNFGLPKQTLPANDNEMKEECAIDDPKRVSVSDIVYSVKQCLEGNLPLVALKNAVQCEEYCKWLPWNNFSALRNIFCHSLEVVVNDLGSPSLSCMLLVCLFLCWVWDCFAQENKFDFNRYDIFFSSILSLLVMISSTCYIIFLHFGYCNVNKWINLIKLFEPNVKSDEVREKYMGQTVIPFLLFFPASFFYNFAQPVYPIKFLSGELLFLGILLSVLVDRTITHQRYFVNFSLVLNGLVCLHKLNFFKLLYSLDFLSFDLSLGIFNHLEIHVTWLFVICLMLPLLYYKMLRGDQKRGWLQTFFPHLMCLTWLKITNDIAVTLTVVETIEGIGFWLTIFLLERIVGSLISLTFCSISKVAYVTKTLTLGKIWHSFFPIVVVSFYVSRSLLKKLKSISLNRKCVLLSLLVLGITLLRTSMSGNVLEEPVLTWNQYETHCHRNSWYHTNIADTKIGCLPLKGKVISLDGTITQIDVIQKRNTMEYVSDLLPSFVFPEISQWFVCAFGQRICDDDNLSTFQKERCKFFRSIKLDECNLHNWDVYQYQVTLEVSSRISPEVIIIADNMCSPFIKKLKDGDSLHVVGILQDGVGSTSPEIILKQATCNTCYEDHNTCGVFRSSSPVDYSSSLRQVVMFYFSPFLQYLD